MLVLKRQKNVKTQTATNIKQKHTKWSEVKVAQSCLTLCHPMNYTVHGILQARIQEWVAFPFSRGSSRPGIEPGSPTLLADSLPTELSRKPWRILHNYWRKRILQFFFFPFGTPIIFMIKCLGLSSMSAFWRVFIINGCWILSKTSWLTLYCCAGDWYVKVAQSCLTFCEHMYYTVHGILQARILEWVAFPFSRGSSQTRD